MDGIATKQKCPICGREGTTSKKWVRNRNGKKYSYTIFSHQGIAHWVNRDMLVASKLPKGEVQTHLLHLLNSNQFKPAVFTVNGIITVMRNTRSTLTNHQIRDSITGLADRGLLIRVGEGREVSYVNSSHLDRLNYVVEGISISLKDPTGDLSFQRHEFNLEILNDNEFPLEYIQFKTVGDVPKTKDQVMFRVYDITAKEKVRTYYLQDEPLKKRIIIVFPSPIPPDGRKKLKLQYSWPVRFNFHSFTSPTVLKSVTFSLSSKVPLILGVKRTISARTKIEDESSRVISLIKKDGTRIEKFRIRNLPSFVTLEFRWQRALNLEFNVASVGTTKRLQ